MVSLGRTEDVQFSPDDRRLAIVGFKQNKVLIPDIKIKTAKSGILVLCEDWLEISSPGFNYPHGIFWMDGSTLIVANRGRDRLHSPGSVSVSKIGRDLLRVMDEETFKRGHMNPKEGGPKGIDLTSDDRILAVSCEEEPIVFFDVRKMIDTPTTLSNFDNKQRENITETEQMRRSLLGHINLMAKSKANSRKLIDRLRKMLEAGIQERNMLVQQLDDVKNEGRLK